MDKSTNSTSFSNQSDNTKQVWAGKATHNQYRLAQTTMTIKKKYMIKLTMHKFS